MLGSIFDNIIFLQLLFSFLPNNFKYSLLFPSISYKVQPSICKKRRVRTLFRLIYSEIPLFGISYSGFLRWKTSNTCSETSSADVARVLGRPFTYAQINLRLVLFGLKKGSWLGGRDIFLFLSSSRAKIGRSATTI